MSLLGGIGDQTVSEAQKDVSTDLAAVQGYVQTDLDKILLALQPVLKLATTLQEILDGGGLRFMKGTGK